MPRPPSYNPRSLARREFTGWKFDKLDEVCLDPRLAGQDFRIAYWLMKHVNVETRMTFVSHGRIATDLDVDVRTVGTCLRKLERLGHMSVRRTMGKSNVYRFLLGQDQGNEDPPT